MPTALAISDYDLAVRDKISAQCDSQFRAYESQVPKPTVGFQIEASGAISGLKLLKSSGDIGFDDTAKTWVTSAAPFAKPLNGGEWFEWDFCYPFDTTVLEKELATQILSKWKPPTDEKTSYVRFECKVMRDGTIPEKRIVSSAGDQSIEDTARGATQDLKVSPLTAYAPPFILIGLKFNSTGRLEEQVQPQANNAGNSYQTYSPRYPAAVLNNDAVRKLNESKYDEAIQLLQRALKIELNYVYARDNLAITFRRAAVTKEPAKALPMLMRAAYLQPASALNEKDLGSTWTLLGIAPSTAESHFRMAEQYRDKGDYVSASVHARFAKEKGFGDKAIELEASLEKSAEAQLLMPIP